MVNQNEIMDIPMNITFEPIHVDLLELVGLAITLVSVFYAAISHLRITKFKSVQELNLWKNYTHNSATNGIVQSCRKLIHQCATQLATNPNIAATPQDHANLMFKVYELESFVADADGRAQEMMLDFIRQIYLHRPFDENDILMWRNTGRVTCDQHVHYFKMVIDPIASDRNKAKRVLKSS